MRKKLGIFLSVRAKLILVKLHLIYFKKQKKRKEISAMKKFSERAYIRLVALFVFLSVSLGVYSLTAARENEKLKLTLTAQNQRAVNELCESIDSITVDLKKCLYAGTRDMLTEQGNRLVREATVAKENLSSLTAEESGSAEIFRFLSQVGSYTLSLGSKEGSRLSAEDAKNLRALYRYSSALNKALSDILNGYNEGTVSFSRVSDTLGDKEAELPDDFYSRIKDTQQTVTDYPTLLYDGPFSDSADSGEAEFLKKESSITRKEAKKIAAEILGCEASALREEKDVSGSIELYCFSMTDTYISITKKGGYLYSFIRNKNASEATITPDEAVTRGKKHLKALGYTGMSESYYSVFDGICTVNYAYIQDSVICYPDLIKVSIALDTGEVLAVDAAAYLSSHKERALPEKLISPSRAKRSVSDSLKILSYRRAFIPDENDKEELCYEFHCKDSEGQQVLVYIDCESAKEQDIMLLLYEDDGVLTK